MKRFAAGVLLGFVLSCGLSYATEDLSHNGTFWSALDSSAKRGYVTGYADAMKISVTKLENLEIAAQLFRWKSAEKIIRQVSRELSIGDVRPEDLVAQLDQFYSDRKYSDLDLGSALQLVKIRVGAAQNQSRGVDKRNSADK